MPASVKQQQKQAEGFYKEIGKLGGRPKGSKTHATLAKEEANKLYREKVMQFISPLLEAQLDAAFGMYVLKEIKDKDGKVVQVRIYKKQPNQEVIESLLSRALGKTKDGADAIGEGIAKLGDVFREILTKKK